MNKRNRSLLMIARVLTVVTLALAVCEGLTGCEESPEWGENIIRLIVGTLDGSVAHRSKPYVIIAPDGRQLPAPAAGTEFTVAVDTAGMFTVQAHVAPEPIAVIEPDGVTLAFIVEAEQEVVTPYEGVPSEPRSIIPIVPEDIITPLQPGNDVAQDTGGTKPIVPEDIITPLQLEIWHPWAGEPEGEQLLDWLFDWFPQGEIRVEGMGLGELMERYPVSVAAGEAPDLVLAPDDAALEWAARGLIQPLDDIEEQGLLADIYPTALDTLRYEGQLWGIPFRAGTVALYYNRKILPEPPGTNTDLLAMVEKGYMLALPDHIYYTYGFLEGYGGQLLDGWGNVVVESEGIYAYLNFVRDLVWSENTFYGPASEMQSLFQDYKAAMIIDGTWMLPLYRESLGDALGVVVLPKVPESGRWSAPVLGTDACLVSAAVSDAKREAAVAFVLFLTGEEFQTMLTQDASSLPVSTQVGIDDPLLDMFAEQAKLASPGIVHPDRGAIWEIVQRMQERVIYEQWSPEEAAKNAAIELYEAGVGQ